MIATIHTGTASTYIYIDPDSGTIEIKAPASLTVNTATATINASGSTAINSPETTISGHVTIQGGLSVSGGNGAEIDGSLTTTGDVVANGISLDSHVHGSVMSGSSDTSAPK
jgi:phage baseplate assembly protein V